MEWEFIAPMFISTVFFVTVGGVLVLRPISKRISELLEFYARDRNTGVDSGVHQMRSPAP